MGKRLAAIALLCLWAPFARAQPLTRGPYLVGVSSVSAKICWRLGEKRSGDACAERPGLAPGASFAYAVPNSTLSYSGKTLPPPGAPLRLAAFGDCGNGGEAQRRVARQLERWDPGFVLLLGDIVYPRGKDDDYGPKYFAPYAGLLPSVPFFPAVGNHDYGNHKFQTEKGEKRFRKHYAVIHQRPAYYSFDAGDAHFISLDTNHEGFGINAAAPVGEGSAQRRWLEEDLNAARARWKIVFLHVQLYSSNTHGDHAALRRSLEPLFVRHGVDLVLQGHNHWYERSKPISGVVYVTAGTGGAGLHDESDREPWSQIAFPAHGFVGATLAGDELSLEMIDADGAVRDRFVLKKSN